MPLMSRAAVTGTWVESRVAVASLGGRLRGAGPAGAGGRAPGPDPWGEVVREGAVRVRPVAGGRWVGRVTGIVDRHGRTPEGACHPMLPPARLARQRPAPDETPVHAIREAIAFDLP